MDVHCTQPLVQLASEVGSVNNNTHPPPIPIHHPLPSLFIDQGLGNLNGGKVCKQREAAAGTERSVWVCVSMVCVWWQIFWASSNLCFPRVCMCV